jgi:hypothetical protein
VTCFGVTCAGDGVNINWSATAINSFAALMTAAKANGWIVTTAAYPTANWAFMAITPIGASYRTAFADRKPAQVRRLISSFSRVDRYESRRGRRGGAISPDSSGVRTAPTIMRWVPPR